MAENVPLSGNDLNFSGVPVNRKFGVWGDAGGGDTNDDAGYGVLGTSFNGAGVAGIAADPGVLGRAIGSGSHTGGGLQRGGIGVVGENNLLAGTGVKGEANGAEGIAILAEAGGTGAIGISSVVGGTGTVSSIGIVSTVRENTHLGIAVQAEHRTGGTRADLCTASLAGFFRGDVSVTGHLYKASGGFRIDHPLDPASKYLTHSFVESPDMKNVYDGVAIVDAKGEAVVTLPVWFEAINKDFRYQLTAIGGAAPNLHIAEEIVSNHFKIAGGSAGLKVSWQVTGIRNDAWAKVHRLQVEEEKPPNQRGLYLQPHLHGQPPERAIEDAHDPGHAQRIKRVEETSVRKK